MSSLTGNISGRQKLEGQATVAIAASPELHIGETITLEPGQEAYVRLAEDSTKLNPKFDFGIPAGKDGVDGKDGIDGVNGKDGAPGKDGVDGKDGYTPVKGVDYFDGVNGKDGKDGIDGAPGEDGVDGKDGEKGDTGTTFIPSVTDGVISWTNDGGLNNPDEVNITGPEGPTGKSGVYMGTEEPTDPDILVWINPEDETFDTCEAIKQSVMESLEPTLENNIKEANDYTDNAISKDFKEITYDSKTATFIFTRHDNTTLTVDLPIESTVKTGRYDEATNELVLVLVSGEEIKIPVTGLIDDYDGVTTATIQCVVSADNKISCNLVSGSISKTLLTTELQNELNGKLNSNLVEQKDLKVTYEDGTVETIKLVVYK